MSTIVVPLASGATSAVFNVTPMQSVCVAPGVLGGTMTLYQGPTPQGPWAAVINASTSAASYRSGTVNSYVYAVSATQVGVLAISDMGLGQGSSPLTETIANCRAVCASPSSTAEVALYSFRLPPLFLKPNFKVEIRAAASFTNNVNAKTLQVRMNGIGGTLAFQSPALASNLNYNFSAVFIGIGDGATLKGIGAGTTGGLGLSTVAYTTLARDYINNETEIVVSCTKATGTDTFQLDSFQANLYQ